MLQNRPYSKKIYELVDSAQIDVYAVMEACLEIMGEDLIKIMVEKNQFFDPKIVEPE